MPKPFLPQEPHRFQAALRRFDEENAQDPHLEVVEGAARPRELVYAHRLSEWVERLCPEASEALRLAARCQHLCRWKIPRESYPLTRAGYLRWREELRRFHAQRAGEILRETGYDQDMVEQVQALNLKKNFPQDTEARTLEDALCLVFLQYQFPELRTKTTEEKVINALQKSWKKMTPAAQAQARLLAYGQAERDLLNRALGAPGQ